jgi:hypothetical protein
MSIRTRIEEVIYGLLTSSPGDLTEGVSIPFTYDETIPRYLLREEYGAMLAWDTQTCALFLFIIDAENGTLEVLKETEAEDWEQYSRGIVPGVRYLYQFPVIFDSVEREPSISMARLISTYLSRYTDRELIRRIPFLGVYDGKLTANGVDLGIAPVFPLECNTRKSLPPLRKNAKTAQIAWKDDAGTIHLYKTKIAEVGSNGWILRNPRVYVDGLLLHKGEIYKASGEAIRRGIIHLAHPVKGELKKIVVRADNDLDREADAFWAELVGEE